MQHQGTNRPDLADVAVEYSTSLAGFIGGKVLPLRPVDQQTAEFDKVETTQQQKEVGSLKRARKAPYPEIEHVTSSDTYSCEEYALKEGTDRKRDKPRLDRSFDWFQVKTQLCTYHLMLEHERRVASAVFNPTTFASYTAGAGTEWDNGGNVYNDVQDTILTLSNNIGGIITPGSRIVLAISKTVFNNIRQNSTVKALIGGGQYSSEDYAAVSPERLASILEVDDVLVGGARYNGADVWDDEYAMLCLVRDDQELANGVQLGRTFVEANQENMSPFMVEEFATDDPPVDYVAVSHSTDEKILTVAAGYLLSNISQ